MKYVTLDEIKSFLGIDPSVTTEDDVLQRLADAAEVLVESFTGKYWGDTVETKTFYMEDTYSVLFYPEVVYDVTDVKVNGTSVDLDTIRFYPYEKPYDYMEFEDTYDVGAKVEVAGVFTWGPVPDAIKTMILRIIYHLYRTKDFYAQAGIYPDQRITDTSKLPQGILNELSQLATSL